jgi:hypothetical protein
VSLPDGPAGTVRLDWLDPASPPEVLAVIHATVDLERALTELAGGDGTMAGPTPEPVPDELLGARVVVIGERSPRIAVAEPSTESRLAATLARHGEGIVGAYVRSPLQLAELRDRAAGAGIVLSRRRAGPFGDEVVVVGTGLGGHQVILVEPGRVPSPG